MLSPGADVLMTPAPQLQDRPPFATNGALTPGGFKQRGGGSHWAFASGSAGLATSKVFSF